MFIFFSCHASKVRKINFQLPRKVLELQLGKQVKESECQMCTLSVTCTHFINSDSILTWLSGIYCSEKKHVNQLWLKCNGNTWEAQTGVKSNVTIGGCQYSRINNCSCVNEGLRVWMHCECVWGRDNLQCMGLTTKRHMNQMFHCFYFSCTTHLCNTSPTW